MLEVRVRGGFSDRNGIKPENVNMQLETLDSNSRIKIYNVLNELYHDIFSSFSDKQCFFKDILKNVYSQTVEYRYNYDESYIFGALKETILNDTYDSVLTIIEYVTNYFFEYLNNCDYYSGKYYSKYSNCSVFDIVNEVFEKEYVGYRIIGGMIVPITNDIEIKEINQSLEIEQEAVNKHISKAVMYLSDRDKPDYENSIKESISAVEALCAAVTGKKGKEATLGKMIYELEDSGVVIHGALKNAFSSLYGFTSDANGIRHAGDIGGKNSSFDEAKFMLVSCSAFINYVLSIKK